MATIQEILASDQINPDSLAKINGNFDNLNDDKLEDNFASFSEKTSLVSNDLFVIADSEDTNAIKKVTKESVRSSIQTPRVTTIASNATPTVNTDECDAVTITALATDITSMTTNLSGTPSNFQTLLYRIKDNGTTRNITWGVSFEAKGVALPTATTASKVLTVGFIYDEVTSKWGCVASVEEA